MPNWCENTITIKGDKEKMKPIVDVLRELEAKETKDLTADIFVMESLLGTDDRPENYDSGGWYDYNVKKFGTKWDFKLIRDGGDYEIHDERITLSVLTAWSPPQQFLITLCEKYDVQATINYAEPGMDFTGSAEYGKDGCITETQTSYMKGKYDNNDYFWEEVENVVYGYLDEVDALNKLKQYLSFLSPHELEQVELIFNQVKTQEEENAKKVE